MKAAPFARYAVALASAGMALALRVTLTPFLGDHAQMLLFALAVMFSAWYGGLGPGIACTAAGIACIALFLLGVPFPASLGRPHHVVALALFGAVGTAICLLTDRMQAARREAEAYALAARRQAAALRESEEVLEQRVRDRTGELAEANEALEAEVAARREIEKGLRESLAQIKTLQGIIPICGYCKRIRDDQDYWEQLEAYISAHTDARFSHGICPHCAETIVIPQIEALKRGSDGPR